MNLQKIKYWQDYLLLIVVFVILIITLATLIVINLENLTTVNILSYLDTASAISLAILGFIGFYQYTKEKNKEKNIMRSFKQQLSQESDKDVALLVQFGGTGDMEAEMKRFANTIVSENNIYYQNFGDQHNKITIEDIDKLKELCIKLKPELIKARNVHILFGGVCIGLAVIADILNNATNLVFYHRVVNQYTPWYIDQKGKPKQEKTLNDLP